MVTEEARRDLAAVVAAAHDAQDNVEALLSLHTEDAVVVNIAGRRVLGRESFARAMAGALASPLARVRTSVEVVDVRLAESGHAGRGRGQLRQDGAWRPRSRYPSAGAGLGRAHLRPGPRGRAVANRLRPDHAAGLIDLLRSAS